MKIPPMIPSMALSVCIFCLMLCFFCNYEKTEENAAFEVDDILNVVTIARVKVSTSKV